MPSIAPSTPSKAESSNAGTKLRSSTPDELEQWAEKVDRRTSLLDIYDLDEAIDYPFRDGDVVWQKQGFYYPVNFGAKSNIRKYFAPLNGEIKPDARVVRHLLLNEGWLEDEYEESMASDSSNDLYEDEE
ncbi:hypothetical protein CPB84DRAFT_1843872 [Gymnopilus junonius]|uniref:Uncharacterized protein n=1 Tax=Gymnopilus junonius TaxID=109634 RepID=A0A9P5NXA4_GYMJU|nr:hypothetical protein CPB84DRAFT_1843872 [Gymnopilus junonius]